MNDILEQFRREYRNYPATSLENQFADEFERMRREVEELKENDEIIRDDYQRLLANAKRMGHELAELRKAQGEPVAWQWRKKSDPWSLDRTFNSQVFATTDDTEVRALYAGVGDTAADN